MQVHKELTSSQQFGDEKIDVLFRQSPKPTEPGLFSLYYAPFEPRTYVEDGIICEQDVAVTLRDGTVIYTDIYRPEGATDLPAIIAWSPYGKRHGFAPKGTQAFLSLGVPPGPSPRARSSKVLTRPTGVGGGTRS